MNIFDLLVFICVVAAISGISPTLISICVSLVAGVRGKGHKSTKIWIAGLAFFAGLISIIVVIGTAFWMLLDALSIQGGQFVGIAVAIIAIAAGIVEIKDYFWYGKGIGHRPHRRLHKVLHARTSKMISPLSAFALGVITVAATASNIGLVTITTATLLQTAGQTPNAAWFVLFGLSLVLGAFFALLTIVSGTKVSAILLWKEEAKPAMRLGSGLALIATAWLILLVLSHTVHIGAQL